MIKDLKQKLKSINMDGWMNVLTGLGVVNKDKRMGAQIDFTPMNEIDAENLYSGDDMAAKIVDMLPDEALREPIELLGFKDDESTKPIFKELERIKAVAALNKAWKYARLYGGSGVFLVTDDVANLSAPMKPNAKINGLVVLSRWELSPDFESIESDLSKPGFGMPKAYRFQPRGYSEQVSQIIHASRVIRFDGADLPERNRIQNQYWNDSILNRLQNAIRNYSTVHDSSASLIHDFRVGIFKIKNLANLIAEGNDNDVIKRLQLVDIGKSITKSIAIDADGEDFEFRTGSVAGMPELIAKAENRLVAGTNMPHTLLLGESPQGSNATGNSSVLGWYDYVASQQEVYLKPKLMSLLKLVIAGMGIQPIAELDVEFAPLWQMDEREASDVRLKMAQADQIYIDLGVVDRTEVAKSRFGGKRYSINTSIDMTLREEPTEIVPTASANPQV